MSTEMRAYGQLRDIVERRGGTMVWHRAGYRYGAWEISVEGKRVVVEAMGVHSFPALDRFYVPRSDVPTSKTWDDYEYELIPAAEEQFLEWIRQQRRRLALLCRRCSITRSSPTELS